MGAGHRLLGQRDGVLISLKPGESSQEYTKMKTKLFILIVVYVLSCGAIERISYCSNNALDCAKDASATMAENRLIAE